MYNITPYYANHYKPGNPAAVPHKVSETFGKIIDDIYTSHQQEATYKKLSAILQEMRNGIESLIKGKDDKYTRLALLGMVSHYKDEINNICPDYGLCKYTPEEIIDNFDFLKEKFL